MSDAASILEFWFGATAPDGAPDPAKYRMWFGDGRQWDDEIRSRFGALHARAARGELDGEWATPPRTRLALILLLDQFPRHIHRGTPAAFAQDGRAQSHALSLIDAGLDSALTPIERVFCYLPLEHAEDLALQERCVALFTTLRDTVAAGQRERYEGFLDYARRHRDVVARFGRFPHRNATLGRVSTPDEAEFLRQPGSSF